MNSKLDIKHGEFIVAVDLIDKDGDAVNQNEALIQYVFEFFSKETAVPAFEDAKRMYFKLRNTYSAEIGGFSFVTELTLWDMEDEEFYTIVNTLEEKNE